MMLATRIERRYVWAKWSRVVVCLAALGLTAVARAEFSEAVQVTDEGATTDCALAIDGADNVFLVSVVSGRLVLDLIGPGLRDRLPLPASEGQQGEPAMASNCCGRTFIAYNQGNPDSVEIGREIHLMDNNGGGFSASRNLSRNGFDDHGARIDLDITGSPHLVWIQEPAEPELGSPAVIYYNGVTNQRSQVALGDLADIATNNDDQNRTAHVLFRSNHDLFYVSNATGVFENPVRVVNTPTQDEFNPNIVINERGDLFITYEAGGNLLFVSKSSHESQFSAARFLDSEVSDSLLTIRNGSLLTIVYRKNGELFYVQGLSSFLLEPKRLGDEGVDRSRPRIAADSEGNLHACFVEGSETYYANNAGTVQADFSAEPRVGEAPLRVNFQDLSSGDVDVWRWTFEGRDGDVAQSNVQNPTHTFERPGKYSVTLRAFNADKESTVVKEDFIIVQEPFNVLEIPNLAVVPNQQEIWVPIIATHPDPLRGFQIHVAHDPTILEYLGCETAHSVTSAVAPQFVQCNNFEEGRQEIGVLLELEPPFRGTTIPPGERQTIFYIRYHVSTNAPIGAKTEIRLVNDSAVSRIFNIFTVDGFSKFPQLKSGTVEIVPVIPPPPFFLRGDIDSNGAIEITDAVKLLGFLFIGGAPPRCQDAADFNDSGVVDISGAISVLNFLFLGGAAPRPPFPVRGIDPTMDDLPFCETN